MSGENQQFDSILEQAASEIRGESIADEAVEAAAARVWARLSNEAQPAGQIRTCADFQALIPDYRAGRLSGRSFSRTIRTSAWPAARRWKVPR